MSENEPEEILIVDDTPESLKLLCGILQQEGYVVRAASQGALALRSVAVKLPSLILLDIRMPGMNGLEVCQQLKSNENTRTLPIIFISALADESDKIRGFQAGGVDYVSKPFNANEVCARVKTHIALRKMQTSLEAEVTKRTAEIVEINNLLQKKIAEKEMILKEAHHRIKNNMSAMMSILSLQADSTKNTEAISALNEARSRMKSMQILYDKLYRSQNINDISMKEYFAPLVREIIQGFPNRAKVQVQTEIDDFRIGPTRGAALAIIANELLSNIGKYAFDGRESGLISVSATKRDHHVTIVIKDDGVGIPATIDIERSSDFGLQLVEMLTNQLNGTIRLERDNGAKWILEFDI